tara:strand:- start:330 stop:560 length:231 start_codon:yes stop_codon:yes gene_type:complete
LKIRNSWEFCNVARVFEYHNEPSQITIGMNESRKVSSILEEPISKTENPYDPTLGDDSNLTAPKICSSSTSPPVLE